MSEVLGTIDSSLGRNTMPTRLELQQSLECIIGVGSVLSDNRMEIDGYIAVARNCQDRLTEEVDQILLDDISVAAIHGDELGLVLEWMIIRGDFKAVKDETPSEAIQSWANTLDMRRETEDHIHACDPHLISDAVQSVGTN